MPFVQKERYDMPDLLEIVRLLRAPGGCPWDREQTHQSIRANFIEETYEAIEAIDTGNLPLLQEELGDVLLQILLHAQMEAETGAFSFADVVDGIAKKLIVRHPHVFSHVVAEDCEQVLQNWDEIKKQTKGHTTHTQVLRSVSPALPALMRTAKIQKKAAGLPEVSRLPKTPVQALETVRETLSGLSKGVAQGAPDVAQAAGDLLFAVADAIRLLGLEPEYTLTLACERFLSAFERQEQDMNHSLNNNLQTDHG